MSEEIKFEGYICVGRYGKSFSEEDNPADIVKELTELAKKG